MLTELFRVWSATVNWHQETKVAGKAHYGRHEAIKRLWGIAQRDETGFRASYLSGTKRNQRSSFASTRWAQMMNVEGVSCAN
ncbi:MAG: hypothetical protein ACTS46_01980 [Candidatus Hodgkinia cicadicola]